MIQIAKISVILSMPRVEMFKIEEKKQVQRASEMTMSPSERLLLCLDLMDLYASIRQPDKINLEQVDNIQWIELLHRK
jgi:hypothetical protein